MTVTSASYSGLVITVVNKDEAGGVGSDWTGTTVSVSVIGTY
jgi:hypothetical protein